MITAGFDCGAKSTKTIILKDGKIVGKGMTLTGFDQVFLFQRESGLFQKYLQEHGAWPGGGGDDLF